MPEDSRADLIRPAIRALAPFQGPPVEQDLRASGRILRLHLNECPYPPSPKVVAALQQAAEGINRYPDSKWRALTGTLSKRLEVPAERIILGNGSDQILQSLAELVLEEGRAAVVPDPSFGRYSTAVRIQGAAVITVPLRPDGANDVAAMLQALTPEVRLVLVCTPNNPTGGMLNGDEIRELARGVPDDVLLVLDEAYFEFARKAGGPDGLAVLRRARSGPWALMRTFSKAYGLAGVRCGYVIARSDALAGEINKLRQSFHVNLLAQVAAEAALADEAYADWLQNQVIEERERLRRGLEALGLKPLPSAANFLTAELDRPAAPVVKALAEQGIMIGTIRTPTPGYETYIRMTVGLPEENDAVLAALKSELAASSETTRPRSASQ